MKATGRYITNKAVMKKLKEISDKFFKEMKTEILEKHPEITSEDYDLLMGITN